MDFYQRHLKSPHWRKLKVEALKRSGNLCEECGADGRETRLELHHLHYRNLGNESREDVKLLCTQKRANCHDFADRMRRFRTKREARARHFERWAARFYGADWKRWIDRGEALEKFNNWREGAA